MATIKSGDSTGLASIDPVSKAIRVTNYSSSGVEVTGHVPDVIAVSSVGEVDNDIIGSFDVTEYSFVSLQLHGTWIGTVKAQESNDNGTWSDVVIQRTGNLLDPYVTLLTGIGLVKIPVIAKYLRVRVTAYTSGTVEGVALAYVKDIHTGQISSTGEVSIASGQTVGLNAGAEVIGHVIVDPSPIALESDLYVGLASDSAFNARNTKDSATTLRSITFTNLAATPRYLKLYDTAGVPTAGSGTPVLLLSLPAVGTLAFPLPAEGFVFANGIGMTMTLKPPHDDTTNTATVDFSMVSVFHA